MSHGTWKNYEIDFMNYLFSLEDASVGHVNFGKTKLKGGGNTSEK